MRLRARRDANHVAIVNRLRQVPGVRVLTLPPDPHRNFGDILLRYGAWAPGVWRMCEIKGEDGKPTPKQQDMIDAGLLVLVRSFEDVIPLL